MFSTRDILGRGARGGEVETLKTALPAGSAETLAFGFKAFDALSAAAFSFFFSFSAAAR